MDKVDCGVPQEVVVPTALSYKELLGHGSKKPLWYCTHWWGEAVLDFLACVFEHAKCRRLSDDVASYWICGYAFRQSSAGEEINASDVRQTPFFRAMSLADGILLVVDSQATVFQRIWCDFELYVNLTSTNSLLDIVTVPGGGQKARLFSGTHLPYESLSDQRKREKRFPLSIFLAGMRVELQDGQASREEDKKQILKFLGKGSGHHLEKANQRLRSVFAKAVWIEALDLGIAEDFDINDPGAISLPEVLSADEQRLELSLSFAHMEKANLAAVRALARAFPLSLEHLQLSFEGCPNVNDQSIWELTRGLPRGLQTLNLDFLGCQAVTDTGIKHLALALPAQLTKLTLHMDNCNCITSTGLHILAANLPRGLHDFCGTFYGTTVDKAFHSVSDFRRFALGTGSRHVRTWMVKAL